MSKRSRFSPSVLVESLDTKLGSILDQWTRVKLLPVGIETAEVRPLREASSAEALC